MKYTKPLDIDNLLLKYNIRPKKKRPKFEDIFSNNSKSEYDIFRDLSQKALTPENIKKLKNDKQALSKMVNGSLFNDGEYMNLSFSGINIKRTAFVFTDLSGCDFSNTILDGCDFTFANLRKCNFTDAVIKDCSFRHAYLKNAIFNGADIMFCDFSGTIFDRQY